MMTGGIRHLSECLGHPIRDCVAGEQDSELTDSDECIWFCEFVVGEQVDVSTGSDGCIWICDCVAGNWGAVIKFITTAMKPSTDENFSLITDLFISYILVDNMILPFSQWN